jgi:hypothetical protein
MAPGSGNIVTKDGTLIDVEIVAHEISYQGRPAQLVLAEDITDRRRAEAGAAGERAAISRTRRKRQQHHPALESGGPINFINDFGLKFFGYPEEALLRPAL